MAPNDEQTPPEPHAPRCARCVLPSVPPDVVLGENGVCQHCAAAERNHPGTASRPRETDLIRTLAQLKRRKKGRFDCLVFCTGHRESVAALYYMVKRYRQVPLVVMLDHGFMQPTAVANVRRAAEALRAELLYLRSGFLRQAFVDIIRDDIPVSICSVCFARNMDQLMAMADDYGIPLLVMGGSRGWMAMAPDAQTSGSLTFSRQQQATTSFLEQLRRKRPEYRRLQRGVQSFFKRRVRIPIISPLWYLDDDPMKREALIRAELGWQPLPIDYPTDASSDCQLNLVAAYLSLRHFGFTNYHAERSQLIRMGELGRQEALDALEADFRQEPYASAIADVLGRMGLSRKDLG